MAEFCPDCWNRINGFNDPKESYVLSWDVDFCEGCGKWTRVVIGKSKHYFLPWLINRLLKR